jgi:hypothetical protein
LITHLFGAPVSAKFAGTETAFRIASNTPHLDVRTRAAKRRRHQNRSGAIMNTFRLLAGVSCVAILATAGTGPARAIEDVPLVIDTISSEDLDRIGARDISQLIYLAPALSVLGGGYFVPEIGAGIKFRGIGDPRLNLSVEGSAALFQPGSVEELWVGSRLGFTLDDISNIEIVSSGSVGLIGGTPSYRFGFGGEIPVLPSTDLFVEGTAAGHFGFSPTDIGIRGGLHFYPARFQTSEIDPVIPTVGRGFQPYVGKSVSALNTGDIIPALDFGADFPLANGLVPGVRGRIGYQWPAGIIEGWGGVQLGFNATPQFTPYVFVEAGSIGGFMANGVGGGTQFNFNETWGIKAEIFGRGGIGTITEGGFKIGAQYNFNSADW